MISVGVRPTATRCRGITLVELVVSIAILAVALTGVTLSISGGIGRSADVMMQTRAVALAQSYLDEILARRFDENSGVRGVPPCWVNCTDPADLGPTVAELSCGRGCFNDVDDYNGLVEGWNTSPAVPLTDADGNLRVGYEGFRVSVTVRYLDPALEGLLPIGVQLPADPGWIQNAKLITVNVSHPSNPAGWDFSAYKGNF